MTTDPGSVDGLLMDLDGTVYLGDVLIPGAAAAIRTLRARGKRVLFVSNKPLASRSTYANKLSRLGIPARADDVITSGYVLAQHLATSVPDLTFYLIGEETLRAELVSFGLTLIPELHEQDAKAVLNSETIDAVIVSFDRTLDYRKLNTAFQALEQGARYYATNGDLTCPLPAGSIPDAGATIAALAALTGRQPDVVAGKPSQLTIGIALTHMHLPADRCMMVGDRLETDILMGQQAGMLTAAVLSGVCTADQVQALSTPPTFVIDSIAELPTCLE